MNDPADRLDEAGRRIGVIAVIESGDRLLVIRRSATVRMPGKVCFPGGGWRYHESLEEALVRECQEELGVPVEPLRALYQSRTPWGTQLHWWQCSLISPTRFSLNRDEIAELFWADQQTLLAHPDLLESNRDFLERWPLGYNR